MTRISVPFSSRCVAKLWRRVWTVMCLRMPAQWAALWQASCKVASTALVELMGQDRLIGLISTDRNSSPLAEQLAVKMFVPLIALSAARALTALNIPWIFRMPPDSSIEQAVRTMAEATQKAGANRGRVREVLASGATLAGAVQFNPRGEMR